jgi:hypothetical protein
VANRMRKILEDANIKLASVASDWLGVSGRAILAQLLAGDEDVKKLAAPRCSCPPWRAFAGP